MSKLIQLRCPKCDRRMMVERAIYDYPRAKRIEIVCYECDDGDFHELAYFDRNGKRIVRDPAITTVTVTEGAKS